MRRVQRCWCCGATLLGSLLGWSVALADPPSVAVDDVIETESGRRYSVIAVRVQECGKHKGRQHLRCIVMPADEPQHGEKTHRIRWYKRGRARR